MLDHTAVAVLAGAFFVAAVLYSSVGHAGASGYLAAMAFMSVPTLMMRPTALVLNLLVASIAAVRFGRSVRIPVAGVRKLVEKGGST